MEAPLNVGADFALRHSGPDFLDADIKSGDLVLFTIARQLTDGAVYAVQVGEYVRVMRLVLLPDGQALLTEGPFTDTAVLASPSSITDPDAVGPYILGRASHILRRFPVPFNVLKGDTEEGSDEGVPEERSGGEFPK